MLSRQYHLLQINFKNKHWTKWDRYLILYNYNDCDCSSRTWMKTKQWNFKDIWLVWTNSQPMLPGSDNLDVPRAQWSPLTNRTILHIMRICHFYNIISDLLSQLLFTLRIIGMIIVHKMNNNKFCNELFLSNIYIFSAAAPWRLHRCWKLPVDL